MKTRSSTLVVAALACVCFGSVARAGGVDGEAAAPTATSAPAPEEIALLLPPARAEPSIAVLRPLQTPPLPPPDTAPRGDGSAPRRGEALLAEPEKLFDIHPKLKLEARLDAGDIAKSQDGATYATGRDLYVKKVRFGVGGRFLANGRYALLVVAEHLEQDAREPEMKLDRAYVDYAFADALAVRAGRAKLPLGRGSLLSSNDVFLKDAAVVGGVDKLFVDDTQLNLQLKGSVAAGVVSWAAAVAQGWQRGDAIHKTASAASVESAQPLFVVRAELALPGFAQPLEAARPGTGRRLSVGASLSAQRGIRYASGAGAEDRSLASLDLTARIGPFSAVVERDAWRVESTVPAVASKSPFGWYAQAAWFVAGPNLEPAIRYESFRERAVPGADQQALSLGLNWYPRAERLKLALDLVHSELGPRSADRLDRASARNVLLLGADLSF